jgi:predicted MPP superfamily phosphohydrolase
MINRLVHFSDLHLKLFKDHDLYREILQLALNEWKTLQPDRITFTGDLLHSKNQLTPEVIEVASWLLTECAKIAKTVLIAGNHDALINNNDRLDSLTQNVKYPLAFLRPVTSQGMVLNTNGVSGARSLNFEFLMLDVPQLTDVDVLQLQSNCEIYIYDIIAYFNLGPASRSQEEYIVLNNIIPLYESFNDRVCGWNANITVNTYVTLDFCNFPKL